MYSKKENFPAHLSLTILKRKKKKKTKQTWMMKETFIILQIAWGFLGPRCIFWECLTIEQIKCHSRVGNGTCGTQSPICQQDKVWHHWDHTKDYQLQWKTLRFNCAITQPCEDKSPAKKPSKMFFGFFFFFREMSKDCITRTYAPSSAYKVPQFGIDR